MISVGGALRLVRRNTPVLPAERIALGRSPGRILAEDIRAASDIPPFDRSAMDGYALLSSDVAAAPVELRVVGTIRAGEGRPGRIRVGTCKAIMTGAPLPLGADAVQRVERTRRDGDRVTILAPVRPGEAVRARGSETIRGRVVLERGSLIGPAEVAVLATFGRTLVPVRRTPRVSILATGDELVDVAGKPGPGQIRNSSAWSLAAQFRRLGVEAESLGIARDDPVELRDRIRETLGRDLVVITGGVSVGKFDFVKCALEDLGFELLFTKVAMRPGRPTVFARKGSTLVFGLPGNPVSTFVAFENFVRPAVGIMTGRQRPGLPRVEGVLTRPFRQSSGREAYLPATASWRSGGWQVRLVSWKGSGDIIGFARANSLAVIPSGCKALAPGERIGLLLLPEWPDKSRG